MEIQHYILNKNKIAEILQKLSVRDRNIIATCFAKLEKENEALFREKCELERQKDTLYILYTQLARSEIIQNECNDEHDLEDQFYETVKILKGKGGKDNA